MPGKRRAERPRRSRLTVVGEQAKRTATWTTHGAEVARVEGQDVDGLMAIGEHDYRCVRKADLQIFVTTDDGCS